MVTSEPAKRVTDSFERKRVDESSKSMRVLSPLWGLDPLSFVIPRAYARGYILAPLRGSVMRLL